MDSMNKYFTITDDKNVKVAKTPITGKLIIKILSLISIICFFMPLCTVSCSGESVNITGLKSTTGFEFYDQKIDGSWWCILLLLIPLAILVFLFITKLSQYKLSMLIVTAASIGVIILLMRYKVKVTDLANENAAQIEFNSAYYINMVSHILILVASLPMLLLLNMKKSYSSLPTNINPAVNTMNRMQQKVCSKCGTVLNENDVFCNTCGTKYEPKLINVCSSCGSPIDRNMKFCSVCGKALAEAEVCCAVAQVVNDAPKSNQTTSANDVIQKAANYFKSLFNIGRKILLSPTTEAISFLQSKNRNAVFGMFAFQAVFSALFSLALSSNTRSFLGVSFAFGGSLHSSLFKSFILTLIVSIAMSFAFAGILLGIGNLFHNKLNYQTTLHITAIRSIAILPVTLAAILLSFFNVFYGLLLFLMGTLAGICYIVISYPLTTPENKNKVPMIIFISTVILSIVSIFVMMRVLGYR